MKLTALAGTRKQQRKDLDLVWPVQIDLDFPTYWFLYRTKSVVRKEFYAQDHYNLFCAVHICSKKSKPKPESKLAVKEITGI